MSEPKKRKRGRPRKHTVAEALTAQQRWRKANKPGHLPRHVAELLLDCVAVNSAELDLQLNRGQVAELVFREWLEQHDPDGSVMQDTQFKRGG